MYKKTILGACLVIVASLSLTGCAVSAGNTEGNGQSVKPSVHGSYNELFPDGSEVPCAWGASSGTQRAGFSLTCDWDAYNAGTVTIVKKPQLDTPHTHGNFVEKFADGTGVQCVWGASASIQDAGYSQSCNWDAYNAAKADK